MLDEDRIKEAVAIAIEAEAGDSIPERVLAEGIVDAEITLKVQRIWAIQRVGWMIRRARERRMDRSERERTGPVVEGPAAWADLPLTIVLRDRSRPRLDYCGLAEIEEYLALLRAAPRRKPARIRLMAEVVSIHRKWNHGKRGIMWLQALEKEREALLLQE